MSKISRKKRRFQIHKKRKLKLKLKKIKEKYFSSKSQEEKTKLINKFIRIAPHINLYDYLK